MDCPSPLKKNIPSSTSGTSSVIGSGNPLNPNTVRMPNNFNFVQQEDPETYNKVQAERQSSQQEQGFRKVNTTPTQRVSPVINIEDEIEYGNKVARNNKRLEEIKERQGVGGSIADAAKSGLATIGAMASSIPAGIIDTYGSMNEANTGALGALGIAADWLKDMKIGDGKSLASQYLSKTLSAPLNLQSELEELSKNQVDAEEIGKRAEKYIGLPEEFNPLSPNNGAVEYLLKVAKANDERAKKGYSGGISQAISDGNYKDAWKLTAINSVQSLPIMLGLVAARGAGASPGLSLAGLGVGTAENEYIKLKEENPNIDKNLLKLNAQLTGLGEAGSEVVGTSLLFNQARRLFQSGAKNEAEKIIKDGVEQFLNTAFKRSFVGSAALADSGGEMANQVWKNATDKWSGVDPNRDYTDNVLDAGIISLATTGSIAGVTKGLSAVIKPKAKATVAADIQSIEQINADIENPNIDDATRAALLEQSGNLTEKVNDEIENSEKENSKLTPEQQLEAVNINTNIDELQTIIDNPNVSENTKKVIQTQIDDLNKQVEEIKPETPVDQTKVLEQFKKDFEGGKLEKQEDVSGGRNIGIYNYGDKIVKLIKAKRGLSDNTLNLMNERLSDMDNVFNPTNSIALEDGSVALLMDKAPGKDAGLLTKAEIESIPQEHWNKFEADLRELSERGVKVDLTKRSNFFYDKNKGFQFLDIDNIQEEPTGKFFKDENGKDFYYPFERNKVFPKEFTNIKDLFDKIAFNDKEKQAYEGIETTKTDNLKPDENESKTRERSEVQSSGSLSPEVGSEQPGSGSSISGNQEVRESQNGEDGSSGTQEEVIDVVEPSPVIGDGSIDTEAELNDYIAQAEEVATQHEQLAEQETDPIEKEEALEIARNARELIANANEELLNESIKNISNQSTVSLEERWQELESKLTDDESRKEFNKIEKELIKRERESIFNVPVEDIPNVINEMSEKRKSGTDTFMEASEGRRVKQIAEEYSKDNKENINDEQLIKYFIKGLRGNPDLDYADGLLVRESVKEHVRRGGDINSLINEAKKIYTKAGYSDKEAGEVVGMMINKILKNAETTTITEQKSIGETKTEKEETTDAISEQSTTSVDVREQTEDGSGVERGNTKGEETTGEVGTEEVPVIAEEKKVSGDDFDNLINQRLPSGGVRETLSNVERETNEKLSQELKEFEGVDFKESLAYGDKVIQEAKTKFGNEYVGELLGSIEKSKIPFENKAVLLVSLENDLRSQLKDNPTDSRLRKQVDLVTKSSVEHLRSGATSAAVGVFRQAARANYAVEEAANSIFSNKELKDRAKVEGAVQSTSEDIQQEYEAVNNEDVNKLIEEGVSERIDEIYEALPSGRRQRADKAIAALDRIQKKLRSKTYDASIGVPVAIVDAGITTIKAAIKAGVDIADAIELGITKIKEKYGQKWDKEDEFRQDMLNGFKEEKISLKDYQASSTIKQELIDAGYGKSINVKTKNGTEKRNILDWKKLTGIEGSFETMKENINRSMEGKGYTEQQINEVQKELENEYTDIHASIIAKSINELNRRNTPRDNTTKTLARRLAELYNLGLYDQNLDTYTNILNNALGLSPSSQQAFSDLKSLNSDLASLIDARDANGNKRSDLALSGLETDIKNKMKRVIERAQFQEGNTFFKVAVGIRNLMSAAQRMMLVKVSQALENPFSGKLNDLHVKLQDAFSKKEWDSKELQAHRKQLGRAMYEDASLRGGGEYGGVGNPFTSKNAIEEYVNGLSKNAMYQAFTGIMSGRLYLDAADSFFKIKRTEKEFTKNLIRVLTDRSNPNGAMTQEDALKYVSEMTTGQSFETSKNEARKIIEGINSRAGKEIIRPVESNVIRVANDIVKDNLVNGQAMTYKQVEQAFKAGYKTAGKSIGHESNNFITDIVQAANRLNQTKLDKALKSKDWATAATLNITEVLLKNLINPFVGGGTNWTIIGLQKMGLPTEYLRSDVGFSEKPIDLTSKQGMKDLDESLSANADRQRMRVRQITGMLTAAAAILALRASGEEDDYKKWLKKHPEAQKLINKIQPVPLTIYLARNEKNMGLVKAIANSLGSRYNAYTDQDKLLKAVGDFYDGYDKGNDKKVQKAWGTIGNLVGRKSQLPYLSSISNFGDTGTKLYKEFVGKKTPKDKPLKGFFEGYFNNGLMDFLNVSPQDINEKDK